MKAVVVEIREPHAAVLAEDGTFRKIKNLNYRVGQTIEIRPAERIGRMTFMRMAAAAAVFIIAGSTIWYSSNTVMAYSSVTIAVEDGEVELTLNKKGEVIGAAVLDGDDTEAAAQAVGQIGASRFHPKALEDTLLLVVEHGRMELKSVESKSDASEKDLEEKLSKIMTDLSGETAGKDGEDAAENSEAAETEDGSFADGRPQNTDSNGPDRMEGEPPERGEPGQSVPANREGQAGLDGQSLPKEGIAEGGLGQEQMDVASGPADAEGQDMTGKTPGTSVAEGQEFTGRVTGEVAAEGREMSGETGADGAVVLEDIAGEAGMASQKVAEPVSDPSVSGTSDQAAGEAGMASQSLAENASAPSGRGFSESAAGEAAMPGGPSNQAGYAGQGAP